MAADARVLAALERVRGDLPEEIDRERAVDRDQAAVARDDRRVVDGMDRQEAHLLSALAAEPGRRARAVPIAKVVIEMPAWMPLRALLILPARCRRIRPVVNISEWTP